MSQRSLLQIPSGVQCFYGPAALTRRAVERRVAEVFTGWSYQEILLPLFDHFEVFARAGSSTQSEHIYRFIGRDGEVLALRPDFTALVAKVVASRMQDWSLPIRLFYTGEVLRYQSPEARHQEDLYQTGLEHIGDGPSADLEVIHVAMEALEQLGIGNAVLTVGHAGFVLGLLDRAGIRDEARLAVLEAMRARDKDRLHQVLGYSKAEPFMTAMELTGGPEILVEAQAIAGSPGCQRALAHLEMLASQLEARAVGHRVQFDLGEVLRFDYYTGMVFEIHAPGLGLPLGGGGRYDSLVGKFGLDRPAVGFSFSLDRLAQVVSSIPSHWSENESAKPVSLEGGLAETFSEAVSLRKQGRKVRLE